MSILITKSSEYQTTTSLVREEYCSYSGSQDLNDAKLEEQTRITTSYSTLLPPISSHIFSSSFFMKVTETGLS